MNSLLCDRQQIVCDHIWARSSLGSTVQALYAKTHPDFASYLYLAAPCSLMMLNPLGFVLLELQRAHSSAKASGSWLETGQRVLTGIGTNPVVFMTFLGIMANGVFDHCLPNILEGILKVGLGVIAADTSRADCEFLTIWFACMYVSYLICMQSVYNYWSCPGVQRVQVSSMDNISRLWHYSLWIIFCILFCLHFCKVFIFSCLHINLMSYTPKSRPTRHAIPDYSDAPVQSDLTVVSVSGAGPGVLCIGAVHARNTDGRQAEINERLHLAGSDDTHLNQMVSNATQRGVYGLEGCSWKFWLPHRFKSQSFICMERETLAWLIIVCECDVRRLFELDITC